jgi:Ca2+-binding RTX toxin-like protein
MLAMITGTSGNDILNGTADKDVINGFAGADTMSGGANDDLYFVDNAKDKVVELANEGHDGVFSSLSATKLWDNVEDLTLFGAAVNGTGNDLSNVITGNDKNNLLDGGTNSDVLVGGKGNDTYIMDHVNDTVVEQDGEGTDLIKSAVDFTASSWVENLTLTGTGNIFGKGNALDNVITGNTGDNQIVGGAGNDTLIGGKGGDVYTIDDVGDKVVELAGQGFDTVVSTVGVYTLSANVEVLSLAATAFEGTGNALANTIMGNDNSNTLDGGKGADTLYGGKGGDVYHVDNVGDAVVEAKDEGKTDAVYSTITIGKLWDNVEFGVLEGTGAFNITGNDLDNRLWGNVGKNSIDGGLGADTMEGGKGADTYTVDNAGDTIVEGKDGGVDLVKSSISYTASGWVENLTLTGSDDVNAFGNELNNLLIGNDGANFLNGMAGKDTMTGGKGSDTYAVDDAGDKVVETVSGADGGIDRVFSTIDFSLASLGNIEKLYLVGDAIKATGNALDNVIEGDDKDNIIDGGKGADIMTGGKGFDTYIIDNIGDVVHEDVSGVVISSIPLSGLIANIDNYYFNTNLGLDFTGDSTNSTVHGGSGNDTIRGNGGFDTLYGHAGNDILFGSDAGGDILDGGTGTDAMTGGKGDDQYYVDNLKDLVTENFGEGTDTIISSITIGKLTQNVENLGLLGNAAINAAGNDLDNAIYGNQAKNILDGGVGQDLLRGAGGDDTLTGGSGADTFAFRLGSTHDGHDTIKDFVKAQDILDFSDVGDINDDGMVDLDDLLACSSVVDHGAGKNVDVVFDNGSAITFTGVGTGAMNSVNDLVADPAQIHVA